VLPLSLVNAGQMLNITAVTLGNQLQIGFLAIPDAVPDVEKLARYTREAFDKLETALSKRSVATKAAAKREPRAAPPTRVKGAKPRRSTVGSRAPTATRAAAAKPGRGRPALQ